jgi:signal transduction histidine kinase
MIKPVGEVNLLIIDDKEANLQLIARFFANAKYSIQSTTEPQQAIALCKEQEFDLILLDIRMPLSGFELSTQIQTSAYNARTPIIFMAEKTDYESIAQAFKLGCRDIITKPFKLEEIISKVNTHSLLYIQERRIRDLMVAKNKIFSIIGHDLRSPYNSLIGFSNLLLENLKPTHNTEAIKFTEIINHISVKNLELLDSLLAYTQDLEKESLSAFSKINVPILLSEILQITQPAATLKSITLTQEVGEPAFILGKRDLIATLIRNVLSNALKFTPKGGTVKIKTQCHEQWVLITVEDNGVGMTPDKIANLFTYSKKEATIGTFGETGTGYGLLLSKEILDKHHGTVTFESNVGKGTTLIISLPRLL